jgi:hypothetical protein
MLKPNKEFIFTCEDEISYHTQGITVQTNSLTLKAPSMISHYAPVISQDVMRALKEGALEFSNKKQDDKDNSKKPEEQKQLENQADEPWKAQDIINILFMSKSIDMDKFRDKFIKLLTEKNICLLDGQISITQSHFEFIGYKEFNRLMGEYIANFLKP